MAPCPASGVTASTTAATGAPIAGTTARWCRRRSIRAAANLSPAELDALGVTSTGIIKLASHDARTWREAPEHRRGAYVERYPNGRPRVAGDYDGDGLRVGTWRFWYEDGRLAREVEYLAGVRERAAREWHPNGAPAAEGFYVAGEREGMWRWWDSAGPSHRRNQLQRRRAHRRARVVAAGDGARRATTATAAPPPLNRRASRRASHLGAPAFATVVCCAADEAFGHGPDRRREIRAQDRRGRSLGEIRWRRSSTAGFATCRSTRARPTPRRPRC